MGKYNINDFALANFNLRLVEQTDDYIEYTDGSKVLLVNKDYFRYYSKNTTEPVPISPDIIMLVEIVRGELLNTVTEYKVFARFDTYKNKSMEVIPDGEH